MAADPQPTDLRVDHRRDPPNVPTDELRFSWRVPADRRGAAQAAYRVLVARERETLADRVGDAWDSGRVSSDRCTDVAYGGAPLAPDETFHWAVRVWDESGEPSPWSEPRTFATAPSGSWPGEWIAHQPDPGDTNGYRSRWRDPEEDPTEWVQIDLGEACRMGTVVLYPAEPFDGPVTPDGGEVSAIHARGDIDEPMHTRDGPTGFGFPARYRVEVARDAAFESPTVVADCTDDEQANPGWDAVEHGTDATGRYVRVVATEPYVVAPEFPREREERAPWAVFALAALEVRGPDGADLAAGAPVTASSSRETATWGREHLTNGVCASATASSSPLLRREVDLPKPVAEARLHVAGLGYAELYVNGDRVGDSVLDPGWTEYDERVLYRTHDVTDHLARGTNALGLWLGRGRFSQNFFGWTGFGSPRARLRLTVTYADGTTREVTTNGDWRATESPVVENDLYDGETYDARREQTGWAALGFDDADWAAAAVVEGPGGRLAPQRTDPIRVVEELDPVDAWTVDGATVLDFGQNVAGRVELAVEDPDADSRIEIQHAELLRDGDVWGRSLRTAEATDTYVARGGERERYAPRFTYHGFRYAKVTGYPGELSPEDATAQVVHTHFDRRGEFDCSDETVSAVQSAAEWSLRTNAHSVPTDCPQRDERFGWTFDGHLSVGAFALNFDTAGFHRKWCRDHDDAGSRHGYMPDTVPFGPGSPAGDPAWTMTRLSIPRAVYEQYGDRSVLAAHYPEMRAFVEFWLSVSRGVIPDESATFGDWLAVGDLDERGLMGLPISLFATLAHYRSTRTLASVAATLELDADAARYRERAAAIREAFNDRFFDADAATYGPGSQAALAGALHAGVVPADREADVAATLAEAVRERGHLTTGFQGVRPLLYALAENGYADLALELVVGPERPSWGYMIEQGATTLWEAWDVEDNLELEPGEGLGDVVSVNQSSFTVVSEWFYEVLAGLRFGDGPGAGAVRIVPRPVAALDHASAAVETRRGRLASRWERTADGLELAVTVPWNGTATVRVPLPDGAERVAEGGDVLWESEPAADLPAGIADVSAVEDAVEVEVGAGDYEFLTE